MAQKRPAEDVEADETIQVPKVRVNDGYTTPSLIKPVSPVSPNLDEEAKNWTPTAPDKKEKEFRNYVSSPRQKTVENLYRQQHEQQTVEFVRAQRERWLKFNTIRLTVWEMLELLDQVVDESDPDTDFTQLDHALQTAQSMKIEFPDEKYDWLHLTAFIHDLGKIMAVTDEAKNLSGLPQWAVVGDTFVVGCKHPTDGIVFPQFFENNPDTKDARYNTRLGIYKEGCGLNNVLMSWGHDEYLYHFCNKYSSIPEEGLHIIRYHSFYPWHKHNNYDFLSTEKDREMLKWVLRFNKHDLYSKAHALPDREELIGYYKGLMDKYFGKEPLWW